MSARKRLQKITVSDDILMDASALCSHLGSDGIRGELTIMRALRALAAFENKKVVSRNHLRLIAPYALRHRLRRDPLDDTGSTVRIERALQEVLP